MDGFDAKHVVGWSIFGLSILALSGAVAVNRVMVVGIQATKARQVQAQRAIQSVYGRTSHWPKDDHDTMLTADDHARVDAAKITFRLDQVDASGHRALYIVYYGDHPIRLSVPERM